MRPHAFGNANEPATTSPPLSLLKDFAAANVPMPPDFSPRAPHPRIPHIPRFTPPHFLPPSFTFTILRFIREVSAEPPESGWSPPRSRVCQNVVHQLPTAPITTNEHRRLRPLQGFHRGLLEPIASSFQKSRTNFPDEPFPTPVQKTPAATRTLFTLQRVGRCTAPPHSHG